MSASIAAIFLRTPAIDPKIHALSPISPTKFLNHRPILHQPPSLLQLSGIRIVAHLITSRRIQTISLILKCTPDHNSFTLAMAQVLHQGTAQGELYLLPGRHNHPRAYLGERRNPTSWHQRLGHPSFRILQNVVKTFGLPGTHLSRDFFCESCSSSKVHKFPYRISPSCASRPLELVHSDLWGPAPITSHLGYRYYVIFIDDHSRFTWLYPLKNKNDVQTIFVQYQNLVERQFNSKIVAFQSDWGGEFQALQSHFTQSGIHHRISCPHTPEQNGTAERKHRHIIETALALLHHAAMPKIYWDEAVATATFLINRLPTPVLNNQFPFQVLHHASPDYDRLRTFGCLCFPNLCAYAQDKLTQRSERCVFLGYSSCHKGYRCLSLLTGRLYISRDVIFSETSFPFASTPTDPSPVPLTAQSSNGLLGPSPMSPAHFPASSLAGCPQFSNSHSPSHEVTFGSRPAVAPVPPSAQSPSSSSIVPDSPSLELALPSSPKSVPPRPPSNPNSPPPPSSKPIRRRSIVDLYASTQHLASRHSPPVCFLSSAIPPDPVTFIEAARHPHWRHAMAEEYSALLRNSTWVLVPRLPHHQPLGCKWVFRTKLAPDNTIARYKARLVVQGFRQRAGIDYRETFSPVVKVTSIRLLLAVAISRGWQIRQLDVSNAFLHGDLTETIHMIQPPGFIHPTYPTHVCLLRKSLYGLKQAPRAWFTKLSTFLISMGFRGSRTDSSLFFYLSPTLTIYLLIYVDDFLVIGSDPRGVDSVISSLTRVFAIRDLGNARNFLGIDLIRTSTGLILSQSRYLTSLLHKADMLYCRPVSNAASTSSTSPTRNLNHPFDPTKFRQIVGILQYLTITRPDICVAVNRACQRMPMPTEADWQAVKHLLRYLKGTLHYGLTFYSTSNRVISVFSDADWAGDKKDRRSTSGYLVYLGPNLISWNTKRQATVARSSTEAEYKSVANATAELIWILSLMQELNIRRQDIPILWCDNLGATYLVKNPVLHARTKHVEIDYHFVRERVASGQLQVKFISSRDQFADIMTKPLPKQRFIWLRSKLHVLPTMRLPGSVKTGPSQVSQLLQPTAIQSHQPDL